MIKCYFDGGSLRNGDENSPAAGCCLLVKYDNEQLVHWRLRSRILKGTNNLAELTGLELILESLKTEDSTVVYGDSQYVIKGVSQWLAGWKAKNWIKSTGEPVLNREKWERIDSLNRAEIQYQWVRGHDGDLGNEIVDRGCRISYMKNRELDIRGTCGLDGILGSI